LRTKVTGAKVTHHFAPAAKIPENECFGSERAQGRKGQVANRLRSKASYKMRKCERAKVRKWTCIKCESGIMRKWRESVYKMRRMKMRK